MSKFKYIGIPVLTLAIGFGAGAAAGTIYGSHNPVSVESEAGDDEISREDVNKLYELKDYIDEYYLGDAENLAEGMYKGLFKALDDPYSVYMDKEEFSAFREAATGKFVGIGVIVTPNDENRIQVVTPIKGGPAEREGVKAGDIIWKVEDKVYTGEEMNDAVSIMKGEEGKPVNITFVRKKNGKKEILEKTIIREEVVSPSVEGEMMADGIGYLRIIQFEDETYNEFIEEMDKLKSQGMKSLVIDIRENGGGNLAVASDIIDELLPEGVIVYTEDKNGKKEYILSDANELGMPMAVLVNENTASAAEILTAALQDSGKGTIIGTKTFGKGVVQIVHGLDDGSGLKLTISEYFSPKGRKINGEGVQPDIDIELNEDSEGIGPDYINEDNQLQKAVEVLKEKQQNQ